MWYTPLYTVWDCNESAPLNILKERPWGKLSLLAAVLQVHPISNEKTRFSFNFTCVLHKPSISLYYWKSLTAKFSFTSKLIKQMLCIKGMEPSEQHVPCSWCLPSCTLCATSPLRKIERCMDVRFCKYFRRCNEKGLCYFFSLNQPSKILPAGKTG